MKRYAIYISLIGFLVVGILLDEGGLALRDTPLILLIFLSHAPALLPVSKQNALLGKPNGMLGRYPEAIIPVIVLVSWVTVGLLGNGQFAPVVSGIAAVIALGTCYAAVRMIDAFSKKSAQITTHLPNFSATALRDIGTRSVYLIRVLLTAASFWELLEYLLTGQSTTWLAILSVATICVVALLALFSIRIERTISQLAASTASQDLAAQLLSKPSDVALYYSGPANSKHTAPAKLAARLGNEGILPVIILREAGAKKILSQAPNSHVWICPKIDTLDAAAQPGLRAVFYINDAIKNGHFVRFKDFSHILLATGELATKHSLPRSCAMYDVIIAPNPAKAELWRTAASPDLAGRIVTVGKVGATASDYTAATAYPSAYPVLTLHLGDWGRNPDADDVKLQEFRNMLLHLIETVMASGLARLEIWFPLPASGAASASLRLLHRDADMAIRSGLTYDGEGIVEPSLVTLKTGMPVTAANSADFLIATSASDLNALRGTGKPLLWFDPAPAPDGITTIEKTAGNFATAVQAAWQECSVSAEFSGAAPETETHFSDFRTLVEKLTSSVEAVTNEEKLS